MFIESRPGEAIVIQLGNNYAQPSVSPGAVPEGHQLEHLTGWAGDRNAAAPVYDTELNRGVGDYYVLYGPSTVPLRALAEGVPAIIKRLQELALNRLAEPLIRNANVRAYLNQWRSFASPEE